MHKAWWLVLLLIPSVAGHTDHGMLAPGTYLNHVQLWEATLEPGEEVEEVLSFSGVPLRADWGWLADVETDGNLSVTLTFDTRLEPADPVIWQVGPGLHTLHARIATDGIHNLTVRNDDEVDRTFSLYYDQTCECNAKIVPRTEGHLWFNHDTDPGMQVDFDFQVFPTLTVPAAEDPPLPGHIFINVDYGHLSADGRDFLVDRTETFRFEPHADPACKEGGRWNGCFTASLVTSEEGRHDIRVYVAHDDPAWQMVLGPEITASAAASPGIPGPGLFMVGLALVGLAGYRRAK